MNPSPRRRSCAVTFWEGFSSCPPYYVRILARCGNARGMSDAEVAISSGIDINRVREIKFMVTWDDVTYRELLAFTTACGFDPTSAADRARAKRYEYICQTRDSTPFQYLRKHPKWESEFLPLLKILKAQIRKPSLAA